MFGKKSGFIALGCLLICGLVIGCGSSDNGNGGDFTGYVQHFGGDDWVPNVEIEALNNDTGELLGISGKSNSSGRVVFNDLPAGKVGFLCKGVAEEWRDTYQFNIDSTAQDEQLWAVDETTYQIAPALAGLDLEDGKAVMAGAVYWVDDQDEEETEEHVGCATVKADPEDGEVRYFGDNGMPTTLLNRTMTNPLVAYFLIANMTPGSKDVKAFMEEDEIGSTNLFVYADSISISNIYTDGSEPNPMPQPIPQECTTN